MIRTAARLLDRLLELRDRLTDTEVMAFSEMRESVRQGRALTERQARWAESVLGRVERKGERA